MGESALRSHRDGAKHKRNMKAKADGSLSLMSGFLVKNSSVRDDERSETTTRNHGNPAAGTFQSFVTRNDCLSAEVLWTLKVVTSHYSFSSCCDVQQLLERMFPDSNIAGQFTCGEKKCAYLCTFGIAPHFKQLLKNSIADQDSYDLLFDESFNRKTHNKQMDIHCRIWGDDAPPQVKTRYYGSVFMGHATAKDMVEHFNCCTEGLVMSKLLRLSMDGPTVNWKFHKEIQTKISDETGKSLIMVGSCGLRIVHGAFRAGSDASSWPIQKLLQSLFRLFKDTPARRNDYVIATGSDKFPLKFCPHRWVENAQVAERAIEIWPQIKVYVKRMSEKAVSNPGTSSYDTVVSCTKDPLIIVKLLCFISIAKQVSQFLVLYQTDKPMMPFIASDLYRMLAGVMKRFIKEDIMDSAKSAVSVMKIDPLAKTSHRSYSKVDIGFAAEQELRSVKRSRPNAVSDKQVFELRIQCKDFLSTMSAKLIEKCPLKYPLARCMACLDPRQLATSKEVCLQKMKKILSLLNPAGRVRGGVDGCDDVLREFEEFIDTTVAENRSTFESFDPHEATSRVDVLLYKSMAKNQYYRLVWGVVKDLLLVYHGQASVERGFSVNRQIEVENLHEESVIAQRLICDHVQSAGGILKVDISKQLLLSAASARQRYMECLDEKRRTKEKEEVSRKRKEVVDEIDELKVKKKRLERDITELTKSADDFAEKSEDTGRLELVAKSNSLRRTAKDKKKQLKELSLRLSEAVEKLKL